MEGDAAEGDAAEGDAAGFRVFVRVWPLFGVKGMGIEYARTRRWGVRGGEGIGGGVGYVLVPKPDATSNGRRPVPRNPSQAE